VESDATMKYLHSSGINIKKVKVASSGKMALEGELANAFENTKLTMKINTVRGAVNSWSSKEMARDASTGGYKGEKGELGLEFANKDIAATFAADFLTGDGPNLSASINVDVPGIDNLSIGGDVAFRTAVDRWGKATGTGGEGVTLEGDKRGLQIRGPNDLRNFPFRIGAQYEVKNDISLSACLNFQDRAAPQVNVKVSQVLNSDTNVGATINMAMEEPSPEITVAGSYALDKDTNLHTSFNYGSKGSGIINLGLKQKLSDSVGLDFSGSLDAIKMDSTKFGIGINISN